MFKMKDIGNFSPTDRRLNLMRNIILNKMSKSHQAELSEALKLIKDIAHKTLREHSLDVVESSFLSKLLNLQINIKNKEYCLRRKIFIWVIWDYFDIIIDLDDELKTKYVELMILMIKECFNEDFLKEIELSNEKALDSLTLNLKDQFDYLFSASGTYTDYWILKYISELIDDSLELESKDRILLLSKINSNILSLSDKDMVEGLQEKIEKIVNEEAFFLGCRSHEG